MEWGCFQVFSLPNGVAATDCGRKLLVSNPRCRDIGQKQVTNLEPFVPWLECTRRCLLFSPLFDKDLHSVLDKCHSKRGVFIANLDSRTPQSSGCIAVWDWVIRRRSRFLLPNPISLYQPQMSRTRKKQKPRWTCGDIKEFMEMPLRFSVSLLIVDWLCTVGSVGCILVFKALHWLKRNTWYVLIILGRSEACAVTSLPVMRSFLLWKVAGIVHASMIKSQCLFKQTKYEKDLKPQTVLVMPELVFGTQNLPGCPETEVHQQFLNRAGHSLQQLLIDFDLSKNAGGRRIFSFWGKMGKRVVSWLKARVFMHAVHDQAMPGFGFLKTVTWDF